MRTNFAYQVTDPAYERYEYEDDSAFREQHKPVRPSTRALAGAAMGLSMAVRECRRNAAEAAPGDAAEVAYWEKRMRECQAVLEWLDRGAP